MTLPGPRVAKKKKAPSGKFAVRNLNKLYAIATKSLSKIARRPNVQYITIGEKTRDGKPTGEPSIIVHVARKVRKLPNKDRVPKYISTKKGKQQRKYVTDVVATRGKPIALGARAGHKLRSFDNDNGVCGLTFKKNSASYLLTNAHVVCALRRGGRTGDVRLLNRANGQFEHVGPVEYATPLQSGTTASDDAAVVRSNSMNVDHMRILDLAEPVFGFGSFGEYLNAIYWYPVNGGSVWCENPQPAVGSCDVEVDGVTIRYTQFWKLAVCNGHATARGHSGAVLYRTHANGYVACGLLFAGEPPDVVFAFPIIPTFNRAWSNLA